MGHEYHVYTKGKYEPVVYGKSKRYYQRIIKENEKQIIKSERVIKSLHEKIKNLKERIEDL